MSSKAPKKKKPRRKGERTMADGTVILEPVGKPSIPIAKIRAAVAKVIAERKREEFSEAATKP